jgi:hypothetical protein
LVLSQKLSMQSNTWQNDAGGLPTYDPRPQWL